MSKAIGAKQAAVRLHHLYTKLFDAYGPQRWWPADSAFEVVLGAFLTQSTAWTSAEKAIANLKAADLLAPEALQACPRSSLEALIKPAGFMKRKAFSILTFTEFLLSKYQGSLGEMAQEPTALLRKQLLSLPGVGKETADAILLYALQHPVAVVDEYLRRIAVRHNLCPQKTGYEELQKLVEAAFQKEKSTENLVQHLNEFHALCVEVGKRHCRKTPRCDSCPLQTDLLCQ